MNPKGERNIPASIAFVLSQRPASIASVKLANRGTPLTPQGRTSIHPYDCPSSFFVCVLASGPASRASVATLAKIYAPKALPLPSIRAARSCPRWISPGSGASPAHAGAPAEHPGHPGGPQRPQKAAGRAGAAARLSARQRGRTCPGSAAARPIDLPSAEGAAGALDPGRAQLPALDLSRIRSRPGHAGAPKSNC